MRVGKQPDEQLLGALRAEGLDTVEGAFAYAAGEELVKPDLGNRSRTRLFLTDQTGKRHELYLKRYGSEKLRERLRRWWTYGPRRSPAAVEMDNIETLHSAALTNMRAVICGEHRGVLGFRRSYVIVTAATGMKLEECISGFLDRNAENPAAPEELAAALGRLLRNLHATGCVHRDLYAAHIFLQESGEGIALSLIDLGRVFAPRWRRRRWRIKDLAQLKYSMPRRRWTHEYWDLFLRSYLESCDDNVLRLWNRAISRKVAMMRFRHRRKIKVGES